MLIDTHAHLNDKRYTQDGNSLDEIVAEISLQAIINVGTTEQNSRESLLLANTYSKVFATVGIHPHYSKDVSKDYLKALKEMVESDLLSLSAKTDSKNSDADSAKSGSKLANFERRIVAIGECGLDYYYDFSPRATQQKVFEEQIFLAYTLGLPLIVHTRDAAKDTLDILKANKNYLAGRAEVGVMHCYSGSKEDAKKYLDLGFYISFAGPVTYPNYKKEDVILAVPRDRLLIETDCPYLTPQAHRGKLNYPSYVKYVAEKIAEVKGLSFECIANLTTSNACRLFGLRKI
ncbi:MAG: TatD family hydrolase [Firmicutes bacterium]|nr:TatD family hydrolase [Bacillota bacterium]